MYARISAILFPVTAILFLGAIFWGYQEHQDKNSVLIKAENQYQRAFHDLTHHMNRLHDELGQTLAVSSDSQGMHRKGLANVWRLTSQAQNEVNQLPLALLPFNKAEQFLSRASNFAYRASIRDLAKQPLSPEEMKTMKSLYATSDTVTKQLGQIQDAVINNRLRWMDVEVAMATENTPHDNTIIDGFRTVDKQLGSYPENEWSPSAMSTDRKLSADGLTGRDMTPQEIKARALAFLGRREGAGTGVKVTESGKKTDLPAYSVTVNGGSSNVQMDYTRKGGHLLWYMNPRSVASANINFDTARNKASQFLVRHDYKEMTPVTYDQYDHVAVFTFTGSKDGVRIYPDKVTVRVALDNGEVVGLQAQDHVFGPKSAASAAGRPQMKKEQVQKGLNPDFKVQDYALAVIENDMRQPVLCHEFVGRINGHRYRIYMNASTGIEEMVEDIPESASPIYR
ncbi:sporulation protein [Cohnella kolymensis]|uniref:Sporulation protein n=1 Tax=Cohnella kolymensis TaxID=1590652 RepID=A0ABR5A1C2_9BACL|nr:germination protein YpeB [Cohnella kolymensis]KIL34858.1 sporulation protein [Cohnella kolymensis]